MPSWHYFSVPVDKAFKTCFSSDTLSEGTAACLEEQQIQAGWRYVYRALLSTPSSPLGGVEVASDELTQMLLLVCSHLTKALKNPLAKLS